MKKLIILFTCFMIGFSLCAGPRGGGRGCPGGGGWGGGGCRPGGGGWGRPGWGGGCRPYCPPPPPPCRPYGPGWGYGGCGYYGNSGLATAAAITSIVANGVAIMNSLTSPQVVVQQQPVVVPQQQVVQTVPQQVIYR